MRWRGKESCRGNGVKWSRMGRKGTRGCGFFAIFDKGNMIGVKDAVGRAIPEAVSLGIGSITYEGTR